MCSHWAGSDRTLVTTAHPQAGRAATHPGTLSFAPSAPINGAEIDWSEYFEDIIGVTKIENAPVENIVLHFYGRTGNYIETKPIHESQKSKWIDEDVLEVRIKVIRNFELERLILSYGSNVKVIEPLDLAKIIDNIHINAHELYLIDSNKIST